jgi:preprotein translocase subunit SecA
MVSLGGIARKLFGSANDRRVRSYKSKIAAINALEEATKALSDEALKPVSTSLTLDTSRLGSAINMEFHDTLEVIARRDKSYPYEN